MCYTAPAMVFPPAAVALHSSLLLELPPVLEARFWRDDYTLKVFTYLDTYIATNMLVCTTVIAKSLGKALLDVSALQYTWHMHLSIMLSMLSCVANLWLILRRPAFYKQHRHRIIVGQRLLRLFTMLLSVARDSAGLQAAAARSLNVMPQEAGHKAAQTVLRAAVQNLVRPLFLGPVITAAHGSWAFRTKYWLPLQVLTVLLAVFGAYRHQYCRMAADPTSALLLQHTCNSVSRVHQFILGSIFGPVLLLAAPGSRISNPAACSSMVMAARTLGWYALTAYGLLMPIAGFCTLEWCMKATWAHQKLRRQLVYGPLGWPRSIIEPRTFGSVCQSFLSWVLVIVVSFGLCWVAVTWAAPQLPLRECVTCEMKGDCQPIDCADSQCSTGAAVIYAQMIIVLIGHIAGTHGFM